MENLSIPTVDLLPFFGEGNQEGKEKAIQTIRLACEDSGFFQIVNHGVSPSLMSRAIELSETFFNYPDEEKLKSKAIFGPAPLPLGYSQQPENSSDKNEYLLMFAPDTESRFARFNVLPDHPPEFRGLLEELCEHLSKTALLVESILNDCLGLPMNFLKEYNNDRSNDFLVALRYFPASGSQNTGISEHEDGNCITFVFQDDTEGLQVLRDGQWLTVTPTPGTIVVNVGDVIQVSKAQIRNLTVEKNGYNRMFGSSGPVIKALPVRPYCMVGCLCGRQFSHRMLPIRSFQQKELKPSLFQVGQCSALCG